MSRGKKVLIAILVIVVAMIVALSLYNRYKPKVITIQTDKVEKKDITQIVTGSGKVKPVMEVKISANVSGEIIELGVKEGDHVKKGRLLIKLDQSRYTAAVDQADAAVRTAMANERLARAQLDQAKKKLDRERKLLKKDLVSQEQYEIVETQYKVSRATREAAAEAVSQAKAALDLTRDELSKTVIKAPADGTISSLDKEIGEIVMGSQLTQDVIMTVADLSAMEVIVEVDENDVPEVKIDDRAVIEVDAFPDIKFEGRVLDISRSAKTKGFGTQDESANFDVKVSILGDVSRLRPGMTASVDVEVETKKEVLAVPIQCITMRDPSKKDDEQGKVDRVKEEDLKEVVFHVTDGAAKMVLVETGISSEYEIEISGEIGEGDEVISGPFRTLNKDIKDGDAVKVDNTFSAEEK